LKVHGTGSPASTVGNLAAIAALLVACGGCTWDSHGPPLSHLPEVCSPPLTQAIVSSQVADRVTDVHGPISNVGVIVGSPVDGESFDSIRIDVVAGTNAAESESDVAQGVEKGVVVRKTFAAPTPGQELLIPISSATSTGTTLVPGSYTAWQVNTYTCNLGTGSAESKGSYSILANITVT
jgi:hypothetical protein